MVTSDVQNLIDRCVALAGRPSAGPEQDLLSGRREEASRVWKEELRRSPGDFRLWHRLAVLHYWDARNSESVGARDKAIAHWSTAIDCWAVLVASDDFWREWAMERAAPCGILERDVNSVQRTMMTRLEVDGMVEPGLVDNYVKAIATVRRNVQKHIEDHLLLQSARESPDGPYHELSWRWGLERAAAERLDALKRIDRIAGQQRSLPGKLTGWMVRNLDGTDSELQAVLNTACVMLNLAAAAGDLPSCGPHMASDLGIVPRIAAFAAGIPMQKADDEAVTKLLEHSKRIAATLEVYIHPQRGRFLAWIDLGWYERCAKELEEGIPSTKPLADQRELQKLLCLACHEQAGRLVANHDFSGAVSSLEIAERFGAPAFRNTWPFEYRMDGMRDRLCEAIQDATGRGKLSRPQALDLVRRLREVGGVSAACARLEAALLS
jgi:hypothetical protein